MNLLFIDTKCNTVTKYSKAESIPHKDEIICFDEEAKEQWLVKQVIHIMIQGHYHGATIMIDKIK